MKDEIAIISCGSELGADHNRNRTGSGPKCLLDYGIIERVENGDCSVVENIEIPCPSPSGEVTNNMRNLEQAIPVYKDLAERVEEQLRKKRFPLILGGGHDISLGTVPGVAAATDGNLGMIILDSHLDSNTPQASITGNLHGMGVAAYTGFGDDNLVNLLTPGPKVKPENVLIIGMNDPDEGEAINAHERGVRWISMDVFGMQRDFTFIKSKINRLCSKVDACMLGIDVDGIDYRDAPGTALRNPDGLRSEEVKEIVKYIAENTPLVAVELVEFAPALDEEDKTLLLLLEVVESIFRKH